MGGPSPYSVDSICPGILTSLKREEVCPTGDADPLLNLGEPDPTQVICVLQRFTDYMDCAQQTVATFPNRLLVAIQKRFPMDRRNYRPFFHHFTKEFTACNTFASLGEQIS